jgi:hypothetical protein
MKAATPSNQDSTATLAEALQAFIVRQRTKDQRRYSQMEAAGKHEEAQGYRGFCHGFGAIIGELYRLETERHASATEGAKEVSNG